MTSVCNIWMICLELNWFVYDPSWMLHLYEFEFVKTFSKSLLGQCEEKTIFKEKLK